jgi:CDP-alcohol phosphatidyltransferase-like enzyme
MPAHASSVAEPQEILVGKPVEIEELVDLYIHRPLARRLVPLLLRTPVTPNQVTLLSGLTGVLAGASLGYAVHHPAWCLVTTGLLFFSVVLDCCDGQLARAQGISSTTGAILDGVADYVVGLALALGASYYMVVYHQNPWFWLLGLAGALSAGIQSALFDHAKTRYIARVGGGYLEREEDIDRVVRERAWARAEGRWGDVVLLWLYERYSRAQHAAFRIAPVNDPVRYRAENAGRMRAWTFLGIGTHYALGYLLTAFAVVWRDTPTVFMLVCCTALNAYLAALVAIEARRVAE